MSSRCSAECRIGVPARKKLVKFSKRKCDFLFVISSSILYLEEECEANPLVVLVVAYLVLRSVRGRTDAHVGDVIA